MTTTRWFLGAFAPGVLLAALVPGMAGGQAGAVRYAVQASVTPCLKRRTEPRSDAAAVDCLAAGTEVRADTAVPFWRRITTPDGISGWSAKKFLTLSAAPDSAAASLLAAVPRWLEVHVVDVGQGDGIWIHTPDDGVPGNGRFEGKNIIIDGGPDASDNTNRMLQYLEAGAHHNAIIDAMIITHPHDDHFPGAEGVLRHFEVREYYDPGYPKDGQSYPAFVAEVGRERAEGEPIRIHRGTVNQLGPLEWGGEIDARFLYSYPGRPDGLGSKNTLENNSSLVLRLQYGDQVFLFMGDAEGKDRDGNPDHARFVEKILLDTVDPALLGATVLKLAHHGSKTSSTTPFIAAVHPRVIIASSGRKAFRGRFLPDPATFQAYCRQDPAVRIYRTDQDDQAEHRTETTDADGDDIVLRTDGTRLEITAWENGKPLADSASRCPSP